jgi:hypothetical protein
MADVVMWLLVALFVFSALLTVGTVGKKREPITPTVAVLTLLLSASM